MPLIRAYIDLLEDEFITITQQLRGLFSDACVLILCVPGIEIAGFEIFHSSIILLVHYIYNFNLSSSHNIELIFLIYKRIEPWHVAYICFLICRMNISIILFCLVTTLAILYKLK